ncbi:MAG: sulfate transporter [Acidobacteria bacterium]|nr:MAG: sulfate transporter [Acidobacteriota bacterium]
MAAGGAGRAGALVREISGGLGDLGTFLPLVLAASLASGLDLAWVLVLAGSMNVATGLAFGQPIPVQPMKAIAAAAIVGEITRGELMAAGLIAGAVVLAAGAAGLADRLAAAIPLPVVRAIQLGIGAKLALRGIAWAAGLPAGGADGWIAALAVGAFLLLAAWRRWPGALLAFAAGFVLLRFDHPGALAAWAPGLPAPALHWPAAADFLGGALRGALPQIPLTLLNSVVAVCALSADLFPGRGLPPRRVATSVGLMNLVAVPLGGLPMCHGSGGLAAQYHFGARTGVSVIALGLLKIGGGVLLGAGSAAVLAAYPAAVLAPMLVFAGYELARAARDARAPAAAATAVSGAAAIVALNTLAGFLIALAVWFGLRALAAAIAGRRPEAA